MTALSSDAEGNLENQLREGKIKIGRHSSFFQTIFVNFLGLLLLLFLFLFLLLLPVNFREFLTASAAFGVVVLLQQV